MVPEHSENKVYVGGERIALEQLKVRRTRKLEMSPIRLTLHNSPFGILWKYLDSCNICF